MSYHFDHAEVIDMRRRWEDGDEAPLEGLWSEVRAYGFPYKRGWMDTNELFHELMNFVATQAESRVDTMHSFEVVKSSAIETTPFARIRWLPGDYRINCITDTYTEDARMRCRRTNKAGKALPSPYEQFNDAVPFLIDEVLRKKQDVTPETMRDAIWTMKGSRLCPAIQEASGHGVTKVVSILRHFKARRVLDPCSGYGDRLIAAIASGVDEYCGFDPNTDLIDGHTRIMRTLPGGERFSIQPIPFEDAELPKEHFNMVYTSPPYGGDTHLELYGAPSSDRRMQSSEKFKGNAWMDWLLKCVVAKCWQALQTNGHMIIHISDHRTNKIVGPLQQFVRTKLRGEVLGVIGMDTGTDFGTGPPKPAWLFRKLA